MLGNRQPQVLGPRLKDMQVVLAMFKADGDRRSFSITRDLTVVGRREDCDLRIPLGDVSRKHCRIIKDGDAVRLEDLGSSNGTYHNNRRVQEAVLAPGDQVRIGPVTFVVQIDGVPADDELAPAPHHDESDTATDLLAAEEAPPEEAQLEEAQLEEAPLEEAQLEEVQPEADGFAEVTAEEPAALEEVNFEAAEPSADDVVLEEALAEPEAVTEDALAEEPVALEEEPAALEEAPAELEEIAAEPEATTEDMEAGPLEDTGDGEAEANFAELAPAPVDHEATLDEIAISTAGSNEDGVHPAAEFKDVSSAETLPGEETELTPELEMPELETPELATAAGTEASGLALDGEQPVEQDLEFSFDDEEPAASDVLDIDFNEAPKEKHKT
jgi:hypothetical protein